MPSNSFIEIEFEDDLPALYKTFDVYVHAPTDHHSEAFGQTYGEALAAGVPSVFALSGMASEFNEDRENALVVPFKDAEAIARGIKELLADESLRSKLSTRGAASVKKDFSFDKMVNKLLKFYNS